VGTRKVEQLDVGKDPGPGSKGWLKVLTIDQVRQIDAILTELGPFGEVRLAKVQGKLHSIRILESESLLPSYHKQDKQDY